MKHLFIPYDLALIAKQKGFNEPCLSEFTIMKDDIRLHLNNHFHTDEKTAPNVPAPLYQQMLDWFREKHNLDISLQVSYPLAWGIYITNLHSRKNALKSSGTIIIPDYYQAFNKALEEAFQLI